MKKKKVRKEEKQDSGIKIEIKGILLILFAIIGLCKFKPLSNIINGFAGFLSGVLWGVLLVVIALIGFYMIIKRKSPNFFMSRLLGLYIIIIGVLCLFHLGYIAKLAENNIISYGTVLEATFNNLIKFMDGSGDIQGGGMIGALVSVSLVKLVSLNGANVVSIVLIICGLIIFTGITIYDIVKFAEKEAKKTVSETMNFVHKNKNREHIKKVEDDYENDKKVVVSSVNEIPQTEEIETIEVDEFNENNDYQFPPISLLMNPPKNNNKENNSVVNETKKILEEVFKDFGIEAHVVDHHIGPAVTQYELDVKAGTKLSKILSLDKELALSLAAKSIHIQAPIPGKRTVGVEIPNKSVSMVCVREILEKVPKNMQDSKLLVTLGKDIMGKPIFCEINKTPHLLVAGSTGSGKSVCINSMLISILMRTKPDEVKLVLVDPKKVELSVYNGVPHLLTPVVTEPKKASIVLQKIVTEMENRYEMFDRSGTKNIAGYNAYVEKKHSADVKKMPYIVVVIDELADLMLVASKEVEESIMRITQMARAAGIHLIVATQRPSTDVITGVVKANIPSRISFAVSSSIDSRTILDMTGAEKLLGKGDMLFLPQGESIPIRVQGTFIKDEEIKEIVKYVISQQKAKYNETFQVAADDLKGATTMTGNDATEEPYYNDMVEFLVSQKKASVSLLQRRFKIGYNRAANAMDLLEKRGIVGPSNGSKPREVLIKDEEQE